LLIILITFIIINVKQEIVKQISVSSYFDLIIVDVLLKYC